MNSELKSYFNNMKYNIEKLENYGFKFINGKYVYQSALQGVGLNMFITIDVDGKIKTEVRDPDFDEPYTLHLVPEAIGGFVGQVKTEYEAILKEIADKCFDPEVFKKRQTNTVIEYIENKYADELEFLWKKFDDNAICRRKDNKKWYAVFLTVAAKKLGLPDNEILEILDLRCNPERAEPIIDNINYFTGYHMNKKHWITVILDGRLADETLFKLIDDSYILTQKK